MPGSAFVPAVTPNTTPSTGGTQPSKQVQKQASIKTNLTPTQLAHLKTGQKVSIAVGPKGDSYIGIEGAYVNLLNTYWGYAKRQLSNGAATLFVEDGVKSTIQWIYAYMLASENDFKAALKLEDMTIAQLADLYVHAAYLEYAAFKARLQGILKFRLQISCPTIDEIQAVAYHVPVLSEYMMKLVADRFTQPLVWDYTPYMEFAAEDKEFEAALDESVSSSLKYLIDRGIKYYAGPHHARYLQWVQHHSRGQASNTSSDPVTTDRDTAPQSSPQPPSASSTSNDSTQASSTSDNQKSRGPFGKRSSATTIPTFNSSTTIPTFNSSTPSVICHNCQEPGHFARDCTNARVERVIGPCYNCQKLGHFARYCTEPRQPRKPTEYVDTSRTHNLHSRRAPSAHADESDRLIGLVTGGEGVETCTRVVNAGEITRTGLTI